MFLRRGLFHEAFISPLVIGRDRSFPEGTGGQVLNDSANMAVARVKMTKDQRRTVWELRPTQLDAIFV